MRFLIRYALLPLAIASCGFSQEPNRRATEPLTTFATNECFAKGDLGIVTPNLYIELRSERNQLLLAQGKKWAGTEQPEVVILFHGQAWKKVPEGFDLAKAIVVSFEKDRVRFFDFNQMEGGFYRRNLAR
jgi:hypothetical protein